MALEEFILLGDALWLDFVNSARGRTVASADRLSDPDAWARWSSLHHLEGASDPVPLAQVLELRARLTELAEAMHDGRVVSAGVIAVLNDHLGRTAGRRCAGESCSLLFTDDSADGSRRWCDAAECGRDARIERRRGLRR
jgi:hypothetical protein